MRTRMNILRSWCAEFMKIVRAGPESALLYKSTEPSHRGSGSPVSDVNDPKPSCNVPRATLRYGSCFFPGRSLRYNLPSGVWVIVPSDPAPERTCMDHTRFP